MSSARLGNGVDPETPLRTTRDKRVARDWATALEARRVPYEAQYVGRHWEFWVPPAHRERALDELGTLEAENTGWPPREEPFDLIGDGTFGGLLWATLLGFFFVVQTTQWQGLPWDLAGRADCELVRAGEWWRTVTALSLHVDLVHVASNAVFGALFFALVCQILGTPLAAATVLVAGAAGNLMNALIQTPPHVSVGASTAVFGAVGILCAHGWQRRARFTRDRFRRWIPLLVGLVFLAYLGVPAAAEEPAPAHRVDVLAHVTGFGAGLVLGGLLGRFAPRLRLGRGNLTLAACTPLFLVACWWLALR